MVLSATTPDELEATLSAAARALTAGKLVVLPTDTVYGLAADAFQPAAVTALLAAKGRGRQMPPPVLVAQPGVLDALGRDIPDYARALVEQFWPGPLTLIVHARPSLKWDLGDTKGTVAVRMPDHEIALDLLSRTGPLATSSANVTGEQAALNAEDAERMLGTSVQVYVDAGPSPVGEASTILDVTGPHPRVMRWGALGVDRLNEVLTPEGRTIEVE